jgi:hypothetical protein
MGEGFYLGRIRGEVRNERLGWGCGVGVSIANYL